MQVDSCLAAFVAFTAVYVCCSACSRTVDSGPGEFQGADNVSHPIGGSAMSQFPHEDAAMHYDPEGAAPRGPVSRVVQIKEEHEARLLAIEGVTGVGVGQDHIGDDAIIVYLRDAASQKRIPTEIEGVSVRAEVSGEIDAY
jgi:hypothetical protein